MSGFTIIPRSVTKAAPFQGLGSPHLPHAKLPYVDHTKTILYGGWGKRGVREWGKCPVNLTGIVDGIMKIPAHPEQRPASSVHDVKYQITTVGPESMLITTTLL